MAESPHYKELLRNLNDCSVEFLVVGGYAVMKYSEPRFTKDLDLWIRPSLENSTATERGSDLEQLRDLLNHTGDK